MTKSESGDALLVVYGAFPAPDGKRLPGDVIFDALVGNGYWLTSRMPGGATNGMRVLFYQAGAGFTGTALLVQTEASCRSDWTLPGANAIMLFPKKLILEDVRIFEEPLVAKPLLERLTFIGNKTHWGHAFRLSPRLIPDADVTVVVKAATEN